MRSNIAQETTNTTSVTNVQLQEMINQGVTATLAACDANTNGVDNHNSGTCARRNERATRECMEMDIQEKDNNQSQNDKTEQENGKSVKEKSSQSQTSTKSQSQIKSKSTPRSRFGKSIENRTRKPKFPKVSPPVPT
ncbi:hypothetical protein Tco_0114077 [Tanacetum coccineum]